MNYKENEIANDTYKITLENGQIFYYKVNNTIELSHITFKLVEDLNDEYINNEKAEPAEAIVFIKDYQSFNEIIKIIRQSIMNNYMTNLDDLKFSIDISNDEEKNNIQKIMQELNVEYIINEIKKPNKKIDEFSTQLKSNTIKSENNGIEKEYTIIDNNIYDNNDERLQQEIEKLLEELIKDENFQKQIQDMGKEKFEELLKERIKLSKKEYSLEEAKDKEISQNNKENITNKVAYNNDGLSNNELGIIVNSPENENKYTTVEESNKGINIVNPNTTSINVSTTNETSNNESNKSTDSSIIEEESNKELQTYYYDNDGNIYDKDFNIIGKIGNNGYTINTENNSLLKNNKPIGYLDNINNINTTNKEKEKPYTKKLIKPNENQAFINMYGIIGIITFLVLLLTIILFIK